MLLGHWPSASLRIANRIVPAGFLPRYWGASVYAALWLVAFQCSVDAVGRWKRQIRGFPSSVGECWIFFFYYASYRGRGPLSDLDWLWVCAVPGSMVNRAFCSRGWFLCLWFVCRSFTGSFMWEDRAGEKPGQRLAERHRELQRFVSWTSV